MGKEEIIEKVNTLLAEEFEMENAQFSPSASVKDTLELDSLDYVDLVVLLEGNFKIKVKQDDFATILTFNDLYNYIQEKSLLVATN